MPWRPHSGPTLQPKTQIQIMHSEMSNSNCIVASLVGTWRGDPLIQRSVSNASINKPGDMGGLSSTRDTIPFDIPATKIAFIGGGFHRGLLVWLCLQPCHPPLWERPSAASTTVWGHLRRPPTVVESIMVDEKAANIAIQVIPDGSHPQ